LKHYTSLKAGKNSTFISGTITIQKQPHN